MCERPPKMRGLLAAQIKRNIIGAVTSGIVAAALCKIYYVDPREKRYKDYYRNFDSEASVRTMSEYLQSTGFKKAT